MNMPLPASPQRPFSAPFAEHYWGPGRGVEEKWGVFVKGTQLPALAQALAPAQPLVIAELGFGTGLNLALALHTFLAHAPAGAHLDFYSTESHPMPPAQLAEIHANLPAAPIPHLATLLAPVRHSWPTLHAGWNAIPLLGRPHPHSATLHLWVGEALEGLQTAHFTAHCWWLDGFSPARNPAMWALPLMQQVARLSQKGTYVATYSVARTVRDTLHAVGFELQKVQGIPPKRHRLQGVFL